MSGTLSDDYLALGLAKELEGKFLYSPATRRWYCVDPDQPDCCRRDDMLRLTWSVRGYLRRVTQEIAGPNAHCSTLLSAQKIKAVEKMLRSDRLLVADPAEWSLTATGMVRR